MGDNVDAWEEFVTKLCDQFQQVDPSRKDELDDEATAVHMKIFGPLHPILSPVCDATTLDEKIHAWNLNVDPAKCSLVKSNIGAGFGDEFVSQCEEVMSLFLE